MAVLLLPAPLLAQNAPNVTLKPDEQGPVAGNIHDESRFEHCFDTALQDPVQGAAQASQWIIEGGGYFARHCLGFAYSLQGGWDLAEKEFARAANEAAIAVDLRAANLYAQAGNAALAAGNPQLAMQHFDAALTRGTLKGLLLGELHLDRARALVALDRLQDARTEFAQVHKLAPEDPLGWLLSAVLARKMDDITRAAADIHVALELGENDPAITLEAGTIAILAGDEETAKNYWVKTITTAPHSEEAPIAQNYLDQVNGAALGENSSQTQNDNGEEDKQSAPMPR